MIGKNKKGQAAMEYLMTYGWALLVIIIVLALFLWIILGLEPTRECSPTSAGFVCSDPMPLVNTNGTAFGEIVNGYGKVVYIKGAFCTDEMADRPTGGVIPVPDADGTRLSQGGSITFSNINHSSGGIGVRCYNSAGTLISDMNAGETFQGTLWIAWNYADDDDIGYDAVRWMDAKFVVDVVE